VARQSADTQSSRASVPETPSARSAETGRDTMIDYAALRTDVADSLIQEFGMKASLVRDGTYRDCWIAVTDYQPKDAASQFANPTERQVAISAGLGDVPATPPDQELDQLVIQNEILVFSEPVKVISPAGVPVVYLAKVKR
jgi:hypothetical protein